LVASVALVSGAAAFAQREPAPAVAGAAGAPTAEQRFLQENCIECHNRTDQSAAALFAGLFFDELDVRTIEHDPETWE
jgi:mono/diheme cytochrome c family protein